MRPQLASGVGEYACGRKTFDELSTGNKWDVLILQIHERDIPVFWDRVRNEVLEGRIECSEDKIHMLTDEPLLYRIKNC